MNAMSQRWDAELVGRALVQAFVTLARIPMARGPKPLRGSWPALVLRDWVDQLAQAGLEESERRDRQQAENRTVIRPTAIEITRMEMAFDWLNELRAIDSGMALVTTMWALRTAQGRSIKSLCAEKNWPKSTFFRKREKAIKMLTETLNARGTPVFESNFEPSEPQNPQVFCRRYGNY